MLFVTEGKLDAAASEIEFAHHLRPTSEVYSRWLARAYLFTHHPREPIAEAQQTLRIEPHDVPTRLAIAGAQEQRADLDQALHTLLALARSDPSETPYVIPDAARLEVKLHGSSRSALARRIDQLTATGKIDPFEAALFYLTIGRKN